jgi:hypothetical protein
MNLNDAVESLDDTEFRHSYEEGEFISGDDYTSRGDSSNNLGNTPSRLKIATRQQINELSQELPTAKKEQS